MKICWEKKFISGSWKLAVESDRKFHVPNRLRTPAHDAQVDVLQFLSAFTGSHYLPTFPAIIYGLGNPFLSNIL